MNEMKKISNALHFHQIQIQWKDIFISMLSMLSRDYILFPKGTKEIKEILRKMILSYLVSL